MRVPCLCRACAVRAPCMCHARLAGAAAAPGRAVHLCRRLCHATGHGQGGTQGATRAGDGVAPKERTASPSPPSLAPAPNPNPLPPLPSPSSSPSPSPQPYPGSTLAPSPPLALTLAFTPYHHPKQVGFSCEGRCLTGLNAKAAAGAPVGSVQQRFSAGKYFVGPPIAGAPRQSEGGA